jgi:hypothetical protein
MPVDRAKELQLAQEALAQAKSSRNKAEGMGRLYMGSDEAKASHDKRQNMAEEDAEVMTERAKQHMKKADVMVNPDSLSNLKKGGVIKSASHRADGIAQRGKTRGKVR